MMLFVEYMTELVSYMYMLVNEAIGFPVMEHRKSRASGSGPASPTNVVLALPTTNFANH